MVEPSTILLFNLLTLENLLSTRCELLQGQLLRLTTFRCRDEAPTCIETEIYHFCYTFT